VRAAWGTRPVIDGWSNEVFAGKTGRLVALGVGGRIVSWKLVDVMGAVIVEYPQEVPFASNTGNAAAAKLKACTKKMKQCESRIHGPQEPPRLCGVSPLLCLGNLILNAKSDMQQMHATCLKDFGTCTRDGS
jgi:hypothetical protein